ncbi:cupredoxin domain-containing protein [Rhizobium jaguaris]|uniref:Amicyanin n=1 Tax=Rhizobium jaguaris TaxID=1312183 RepID=A0A387FU86_9HYPH|nr:cupredoxin domain-containing protein [Rhizobium jaguaris]AYG61963.1 amicyanin [Rhizobium jaguaris]
MRIACEGRLGLVGLGLLLSVLPTEAATIEVTIEKLEFKPAVINATAGDTIRWVNKDIMAHTATADGRFDVVIQPHQSASTAVSKAGAVDYYCRFHPNMRGRLEVAE